MRKHCKNGVELPRITADDMLLSFHRLISFENDLQYIMCPVSNKVAVLLDMGAEHCSDCKVRIRH